MFRVAGNYFRTIFPAFHQLLRTIEPKLAFKLFGFCAVAFVAALHENRPDPLFKKIQLPGSRLCSAERTRDCARGGDPRSASPAASEARHGRHPARPHLCDRHPITELTHKAGVVGGHAKLNNTAFFWGRGKKARIMPRG